VLNKGSSSANTTLHSSAARPSVSADAVVKSTTDASVCLSESFTVDELDDDFEPLPFCKLFQLLAFLASCHEYVY